MSTSAKDLVSSYGHALDFDRMLAMPRTIAICWSLAALLFAVSGLPGAFDATRSLACGGAVPGNWLPLDPPRANASPAPPAQPTPSR